MMDIFDGMVAELRDHMPHHHHDVPVIPDIPTTQESHMTTPQQPQRLVDSLHAITGEIQQNQLVARLLESSLGTRLTQSQAALVIAQVTEYEKQNMTIDQAHAQLAAQQQHDGAQQAG